MGGGRARRLGHVDLGPAHAQAEPEGQVAHRPKPQPELADGLTLRLPASADPGRFVYQAGRYGAVPEGGGYHVWRFEWAELAPTRRPMPGLDDLLLSDGAIAALEERVGPAAAVQRVVLTDLGRTWRVAEVAEALETSARSLQRALADAGERCSDVVDRVRNEEAARLLAHGDLSVTEVGYVCGFADSAHFSRSFKRRFGCPPSTYRAR